MVIETESALKGWELILGTGCKFSVQSQAGALLKEPVHFRRAPLGAVGRRTDRQPCFARLLSLRGSFGKACVALARGADRSSLRSRCSDPFLCYAARDCRAVGHPAIELCCSVDG